jgi:hypothetical protein
MNKIIISIIGAALLQSCSTSTPIKTSEQFCDLRSETVVIKGDHGQVQNEKTVEVMKCSDNRFDRIYQTKIGLAKYCGESPIRRYKNGQIIESKAYACLKPDGTWEVIDLYNLY